MREPYYISNDELRKVQLVLLEILVEIDRVCRKNNIVYYITSGTMLGAVRHKGFIPWDDDADVSIQRNEYNRFVDACKTDLDSTRFYLQDHNNTPGYRWGYGKLRRKGSQYVRMGQEHMPYEQGIFVDLFPIDHAPNNYILRALHHFHCFVYRKIFWSAVGMYTAKGAERVAYILLNKIPTKFLYARYNKFIESCNKKSTKWTRVITFPPPTRDFAYKKKGAGVCEVEFEGVMLFGMKDYDEYFTIKYGDYMKLPPEDERKQKHPVSSLKLPD